MRTKFIALLIPFTLCACGKEGGSPCPLCPECIDPTPATVNYDIISLQPFYTDLLDRCKDDTILGFPEGVEHESNLLIAGATNLSNALENVSYKDENCLKDNKINKDTFKMFGKNQIILIQSHGDYVDEYTHETIVTGEDYIEEDIPKEDKDKIVQSSTFNEKTGKMMSALTPEFVKAYCPDISGSIVYMGQCHGAHDYALATAFLDKGAVAVYGSTLAIQMHYGDMMQYRVTSLLSEVNPNTKNYYTTNEALKQAQSEYGINDSAKYGGGAMGARMILFGDPNLRLANK